MFKRKLFALLCACFIASDANAELIVTSLGKNYTPEVGCTVKQVAADIGGSTSVRNDAAENLTLKSSRYFQRNRDLGQVLVATRSGQADRLILRTGYSDVAELSGTAGQELFVHCFEVQGTPVVSDNGTPQGTRAKHGFSTNHRCDDFVEGIKPTLRSEEEPPQGSDNRREMIHESMLPDGDARFKLTPQTLGFPDVDTYRDHEFYIVQSGLNVTRADDPPTGASVRIKQVIRDKT